MRYTRREFGLMTRWRGWRCRSRALADTIVGGVRVGVQSYSFRELPRTPGGDATASIIKAMTATGLTETELLAPQIEPVRAAAARGVTRGAAEGARGAPALAARDAARPLPRHPQAVRVGGPVDCRLQLQPRRQLHRRGDRSRVRDHEGARRRLHHLVDDAGGGEAHRAVRGETQDNRGDAQPLEHERSERVRHARELCRRA